MMMLGIIGRHPCWSLATGGSASIWVAMLVKHGMVPALMLLGVMMIIAAIVHALTRSARNFS